MVKKQRYCLTKLRFSLDMVSLIIRALLSQDESIQKVRSTYINGIFHKKDIVSAMIIRKHLVRFGLKSKDSELLQNSA